MEKLLEIINVIQQNRNRDLISELKITDHLSNDLGLESLDLAELTVRLEAEYDVDIFEEEIVLTVKDVIEKLNNE